MTVQLKDGDILLVQMAPNDKLDKLISFGETLQQITTGGTQPVQETHVMLFVDLRSQDEKLNQRERDLNPGDSRAHLIHSEPDGLIGCPLTVGSAGHQEKFEVLRCKDPKLAACAAQIAAELYLHSGMGVNSSYNWKEYGSSGVKIVQLMTGDLAKYALVGWSVWSLASGLYSGGLVGLGTEVVRLGLMGKGVYDLKQALDWFSSESNLNMARAGTLCQNRKEFKLFTQFHSYYNFKARPKEGVSVDTVCSSFAILCYQLAYVKLIRWFGHPGLGDIGPHQRQSPTGLKELYLSSGLFESMGMLKGVYAGTTRKNPTEIADYKRNYGVLLNNKAGTFSIAGKPPYAESRT